MPIIDLNIIQQDKEKTDDEITLISNSKSVLYIGEVQSGKTKKILNIINNVANKGLYDAVIYFGGTNNLLNNQSQERFFWSKNRSLKIAEYNLDKKTLNNGWW